MNITLGENIKRLRRDRQLTQEQLAEALDVSFQAVSKWENRAAYPDIELLPVIANYFDVSVDVLLGVDIEKKEEEIRKILDKAYDLRKKGKFYDNICVLREGIKQYPNSAIMLYELAGAINCHYFKSDLVTDSDEKNKASAEIIELCNKAMKYSNEIWLHSCCKQLMIFSHANLGEFDKAKEIADTMDSAWVSREMLYPRATNDKEEKLGIYQGNILLFTDILCIMLKRAVSLGASMGEYTVEQQLEMELTVEKLILMMLGENPCFFNERLCNINMAIMWEYTKLKRYDEAVSAAEKALKYAEDYYKPRPEGRTYSVFWLSKEVDSPPEENIPDNENTLFDDLEIQLNAMCGHDEYFKGDKRFIALREKVAAKKTMP